MEIPLLQIISLVPGAGRLLNSIVSGTKGGFDSILGTFLPGARGRGSTNGALFPIPPQVTQMDKDMLRQILASGSGLLMLHLVGMMNKMGIDVNSFVSMMAKGPGSISDNTLKSMMVHLGFNTHDISCVLSIKDLKEDVKARIFSAIHDRLLQECNEHGIDMNTLMEQVRQGQGNMAGLKAIVDASGLPMADNSSMDIEVSIKDVIRSAIGHVASKAEGLDNETDTLTAQKLEGILDTITDSLDIDRDTLKDLLFSTQKDKRGSAADKVIKMVSRYLKTHRQQKISHKVIESLGFIKSITDDKEWSGIKQVIKTWHPELTGLVPNIKLDKPMFMLLAEKMGESPGSVFSSDVNQVIDQLRVALPQHVKNGEGRVSVKLYPPMLGRVDISLTLHDGNISAVFRTDHAFTRDILHHHMPLLREALSEQGIRINHFTVMTGLGSENQHSAGGYAFNGHSGRPWPGHHNMPKDSGIAGTSQTDYPAGLEVTGINGQYSSAHENGLDLFI